MSNESRPPVFYERRTYRRRRLVDAIRLLPFLGVLVFFVPLLTGENGSLALAGIYIFAAWGGLIVLAALLTRYLRHDGTDSPDGWGGSDP